MNANAVKQPERTLAVRELFTFKLTLSSEYLLWAGTVDSIHVLSLHSRFPAVFCGSVKKQQNGVGIQSLR